MKEITSNIYYVGVNDRNKNLFEGLWPLPKGVSYNSYLIVDEKVCLVDTVEVDFFTQFIENIRDVIGDRPIDYIVVNHMEPDHSGSLALMRKYYPNVTVIGNKKTFGMMAGFYGIGGGCEHEVKNGDTLSLGKHEGPLARDHGNARHHHPHAVLRRCLRLLRRPQRRRC